MIQKLWRIVKKGAVWAFLAAVFFHPGGSARAQSTNDTTYDLNTYNLLTPVKNQNPLGTCWAFAATTVFQSAILKARLVNSPTNPQIDISTWSLATQNGSSVNNLNPPYSEYGGFNEFAIGYWMRGMGQWNLTNNPQNMVATAGGGPVMITNNINNVYPFDKVPTPTGSLAPYVPPASQALSPYMLSQSVAFTWNGNTNNLAAFQNTLKSALLKYGALTTYLFAGSESTTGGIYYNTTTNSADHAVTLAGWNTTNTLAGTITNISVGVTNTPTNIVFNTTGGWYIQNSYGTSNGTDGYYWSPFADTSAANVKNAFAVVVTSNVYTNAVNGQTNFYAPNVLQNQFYAPTQTANGSFTSVGFAAGTPNIAAESLALPANTYVSSLGLWESYSNTTVTVSVYTNWGSNGPVGSSILTQTNTLNPDGPGYNMVNLTNGTIFSGAGGGYYLVLNYGTNQSNAIPVDPSTTSLMNLTNDNYASGISLISSNGINWINVSTITNSSVTTNSIVFLKGFSLIVPLDNASTNYYIKSAYAFTVSGANQTSAASNSINGLNFYDGGTLTLYGALTVSNGLFTVYGTNATGVIPATGTIQGNYSLIVPQDFTVEGGGTLVVAANVNPVEVPGNLTINGINSALSIGNTFNISQALNVNPGAALMVYQGGVLGVGTKANIFGGTVTVTGQFLIGNTLTLETGSLVQAQASGQILVGSGVLAEAGALVIGKEGTVENNGQINANVNNQGGFLGTGLVVGNMINGGKLAPGNESNPTGTLTINGNFTQTSTGTLALIIVGLGQNSQLFVNGSVTLGGTLQVTNINGYTLQYGNKYTFLSSTASINGSFSSMEVPTGERGRLLIAGDPSASILMAPQSYTQVAQNQNQTNVARALNSFIPATSGDQLLVSTALDSLTASQYNAAFNAIEPTLYQSLSTIAFNLANAQNSELVQRLWGLRVAGTGFSMTGFADNTVVIEGQGDGDKGILDAKKDILRPGEGSHWGMFVDGNGIFAVANSANMLPNYNSQSGGVTTGLTYKWNEAFGTGIYAGYEGSYAKYNNNGSGLGGVSQGSPSRLIDNSVRFGLFGTYGQPNGKGFYADALAGGGYNNYQVSRNISFGGSTGINRTANSTPGAGELDSMLAGGYDVKRGNFTFGPTASLQYTYFGANSVNETGAQSLDFNSGGWNTSSLLYSLGAHAAYTWQANKDIVVVPQVSLSWQHEFMQNPYSINGTVGGSPSFANTSSAPLRDTLYTGVGFTVEFAKKWNTSLFYNASAGNQNLVSQNIFWSAGVKF